MTKIMMMLWIMGPNGALLDPVFIGGWMNIAECEDSITALFARNPHDGFRLQGIGRCMVVPK